jgi:hypothetical protein
MKKQVKSTRTKKKTPPKVVRVAPPRPKKPKKPTKTPIKRKLATPKRPPQPFALLDVGQFIKEARRQAKQVSKNAREFNKQFGKFWKPEQARTWKNAKQRITYAAKKAPPPFVPPPPIQKPPPRPPDAPRIGGAEMARANQLVADANLEGDTYEKFSYLVTVQKFVDSTMRTGDTITDGYITQENLRIFLNTFNWYSKMARGKKMGTVKISRGEKATATEFVSQAEADVIRKKARRDREIATKNEIARLRREVADLKSERDKKK